MAQILTNKRKRERDKVKIRNPKFLNSIQVPTSNRFDALSSNDTAMQTDQSQPVKKSSISPIVITDHETNLAPILNGIDTCHIKIISVGRKIFPNSTEDKTKIIDALKANGRIGFFSHADTDSKSFKVILSGLPEIDTGLITASIHDQIKV